jgi:hypothetical protein
MSSKFKTLVAIERRDAYQMLMVPRGSSIRQFLELIRERESGRPLAHVWYEGAELYQDELFDDYWRDGIPFFVTFGGD